MTGRRLRLVRLAAILAGAACADSAGPSDVLVVATVSVSPGGGSLIVGQTLQLTATGRTTSGITVPNRTITWSSSNSGVASVSTTGLVTGVAIGGPVTITATIDGRTGSIQISVTPIPVNTIEVTPSESSILVGGAVQLSATLRGAGGEVLTGRPVSWTSGAPGIATVTTEGMVVGVNQGGPVSITAQSEGKAGTGLVTVGARPASRLAFLTHPSNGVAGQAIAPAVRLAVQDDIGNTVAGATTAISLALSTNPGGAVLGGTTTVNAVNGVATFGNLTLDKAASGYVLTATAAPLAPALSNPFAIAGGAAAAATITTQPSAAAVSGAAFGRQPVLQLRDALGNPAPQAGVTVTATLASGTGTVGGTITALSNASGVVTFTNLSITGAAGNYTLRFTPTGLPAVVSETIALTAGSATQLAIITQPSAAAASGVPFATQPVVELRDASNNPVTQAGVLITVAIASGTGTLGGTATVATNGSGRASFAGLSITGPAGGYTLGFSAPGLTGATSGTITLGAGAPVALALVTQPSAAATVGVAFPTQPVVELRDASGNPVAQSGVAVTVSVVSGVGALGGTLTVLTGANGRAVFAGLSLTGSAGPFVLGFASPGLGGALSNTVVLSPGAPAGLTIATPPSSTAQSGVPLAQQPVIQIVDAGGNPVSQAGTTITAVLASGPGTLGGTLTAVTGGTGAASFTNLAITGASGTYTIQFSAPGLGTITSGIIGLGAGVATQLSITTQPSAAAQSGVAFATQPVIQLRDASNNVVAQAGVTVTAAITPPGTGTLGGTATAVTNASGVATFTDLQISGLVGDRTLTFTAPGLTSVVSGTITLSAGPAARLAMVTQPSASVQNTVVFPTQPAVRLEDGAGNPVSQAGTVITAAIGTGAGALGGTLTASTNASGVATFTNLAITGVVGDRTLSFTSGALTPVSSATVTVTPGPQTQLAITTQPSATAQSGVAFAQQPVIQLQDVSGNSVSAAGVNVAVAIATGGGTLTGTTPVATNAAGQAVFTDLGITGAAGARTLTFSAAGLVAVTSGTVTLSAGTATQLTITTQPSAAAQSGVVLAQQPVIQLRDAANNPVSEAGRTITAVLVGGGALGGTVTAVTNASGVATFTNLVISGTVGNYTLRFDEPGLPSVTSNTIALSAGSPARLGITQQPSPTASSGVAFAQQPIIQILDAAGNNVSQGGTAITAAIATGAGATLGGTTVVVTDGTGRATYSNLELTGTSGNFTLRFTAAGLTDTVSTTIALGAGAASKLSLSTQPSASVVNGVDFPQQPVIQLRDAADNPVAQGGVVVSVTILSGAGTLSGTTTATTNASGVATFTNLRLTGVVGDRTLIFAAGGFVSVTSNPVTVTPGAPTALSLTTAPSAAARSSLPFVQQPVLQLRDQSGNAVAEAGRTVTAAIASGGAAISGGTSVVTDGTGQAAFATLSITGLAGVRTIGFSSAGLTGVTSGNVTVSAGPATQLSITTQPGTTSAVSGAPIAPQPVVRLLDGAGNTVDSAGATITAVVASGGAVLSGTTGVATDGSGVATYTDLVLTGAAGPHTLRFDAAGLTSATSAAFSVTAGAATQLSITTAPSAAAQSGVALVTQPAIQLRDASSNPVGQSGVTITATIASGPGGGSLTSATAVTDGTGLATFAGLAITGTVGTYTLQFSSGALTPATSGNIVLSAGAAASLAITTQPSAAARSALPLAQVPVVTVRDGALNPVAGATVTAALVGGGALSGTTNGVSDAAGQVAFTGLTITGTAGNKTLDFSSAGVTTVGSTTIALAAGPATKLGITTQPSGSVANDAAFPQQPVIQLLDSADNPLDSAGATITASVQTGSGVLGGTLTAVTNASGTATFVDLKLTGATGGRTLAFSAAPLTAAVSNTVTVTPGTPTQLAIVQQPPATIGNGAILTPNPSVRLQDVSGNNVLTAGTAVTVSLGSGDPALGGTLSQNTDASGIASFTDLTITGTLGARTLAFASAGLTGVTSGTVTTTAGAAAKLTITTAPPAAAQSGIALTTQPAIQLRDGSDNPVAQAGVTINAVIATSPGGTPSLTSGSAVTDGTGLATFAGLAINGQVGDYTLRFESGALATVTSGAITLSAGTAATIAANSATSQSATVANAVAAPPSVLVTDNGGNPVAGTNVTFTLTADGTGGSISPASPAVIATNASGIATLTTWTLGTAAGTNNNTVTATAAGLAGSPVTFNASGTADVATTIAANSATSQSAAVSTTVAAPPSVLVTDTHGNPVSGTSVTFTLTVDGTGGSIVPATPAVIATGANGIATLTSWTLGSAAGTDNNTVTATAAGLGGSPVTFNASGTAGAATKVTIQTTPSATGRSTIALTQQPTVQLRDAGDNPVAQAGVTVTATFATTPGGSPAFAAGTATATTDGTGLATFSGLTINGQVGGYTLTFTGTGVAGTATSGTVTLSAGPATQLSITTQPGGTSAVNGSPLNPQPVIQLRDSVGNVVDSAGATITATKASGPATLTGGPSAVTNGSGVATFTDLVLTGTAGAHTLQFTAAPLTAVTSASFNVTPGAPATVTILTQPPATANNAATLTTSPVVEVRDASNNLITGQSVTATLATGAGTGTLNGTTVVATDGSGQATFGDLNIVGTVGTYSIQFTAGAASATSNDITLSAGVATALAITTQPEASPAAGVAFSPQPVVRLVDSGGNTVTSDGVTITAALNTVSGGPATLGGTPTADTSSGVATFAGLSISAAGTYTITFTSPPLTSVTSILITVP